MHNICLIEQKDKLDISNIGIQTTQKPLRHRPLLLDSIREMFVDISAPLKANVMFNIFYYAPFQGMEG